MLTPRRRQPGATGQGRPATGAAATRALAAAGCGLLALVALMLAGSAVGARALSGPGTIRITDRLVRHTHVNVGPAGSRAGDLDFYRDLLFNTRITNNSIGHSDVTCINTGTGSSNCTGTYFLPKGKIMVGGVIATRLFYELAVYGGTGVYDNVRGTVTVTYMGGSPVEEFLLFRLVE